MSQSICYFPTSIALLDDNKEFVTSLSDYYITKGGMKFEGFTQISKARVFLENSESLSGLLPTVQLESNEFQHTILDINVGEIRNLSKVKNTNNIVSCVIVDFKMPEMNGLAFLRSLNLDKSVTKILLTGEADNNIAVQAFNEGLIDYYVPKGDQNFLEHLSFYIHNAQERYFKECTDLIYKGLKLNNQLKTVLGEPEFDILFQEIVKKYKITEYYLVDETGSFALQDWMGNNYELIITTHAHLNTLCDLVDDDTFQDSQMIKDLRNGKILLASLYGKDIAIPAVKEWDKLIKPAQHIKCSENIFSYYFGQSKNFTLS